MSVLLLYGFGRNPATAGFTFICGEMVCSIKLCIKRFENLEGVCLVGLLSWNLDTFVAILIKISGIAFCYFVIYNVK